MKTSLIGRRRLVPVEGAVDEGGVVHVSFSKASMLRVPVPAVPVTPAMDECDALEERYRRAAGAPSRTSSWEDGGLLEWCADPSLPPETGDT